MGTQEEKLAGKEPHRDNTLLCGNIKKMAELIQKDKQAKGTTPYTMNAAFKDLGISYRSYLRWRDEPGNGISPGSLDILFKKYKGTFLPPLKSADDLIEKDISEELQLISNLSINFLKLFCNTYNVYYFSSHVPEEIHFGRLRLFTEGEHVSAKLVIGLPESDSLHDPDLNRIFDKNSNSFDEYNKYKSKQIRFEDRNSYYYYGTAEISAPMLILTMYGRDKDNRENDHKLQVLINVRKIIDREIEEPGGRPYLTGMSTVISMPNKKHSSLRIFRMGLSGWDIPDKDINSLIPLLRHNHTENQRIIMTEEDDRNWLSATAKYQPKTAEN